MDLRGFGATGQSNTLVLINGRRLNDIDMAAVAGMGMTYGGERVGPLVIADKIGLDVVVETLEKLAEELGPRFRPSRPLKLRVRAGHLGESTGKGFHEYA